MPTLTQMSEQELLKLYSQICADSYGPSKPSDCDNNLPQGWSKLNLVINKQESRKYYYNFQEETGLLNGFDAAIYYNSTTGEAIVGIRGTEPAANDGDIRESALILNNNTNLTQFDVLNTFNTIVQDTLQNINYSGTYKVVGQSLGGALASVYVNRTFTDITYTCSEAITINAIGVKYAYSNYNSNVTNYIVMNDFFAMLNYNQQIGDVKLVFPIAMPNSSLGFLSPHNDVIFNNDTAEFMKKHILTMNANDWSKEKGVSLWYYDKNNYFHMLPPSFILSLATLIENNNLINPYDVIALTNILSELNQSIVNSLESGIQKVNFISQLLTNIEQQAQNIENISEFLQNVNPFINFIASSIWDFANQIENTANKTNLIVEQLSNILNNIENIENDIIRMNQTVNDTSQTAINIANIIYNISTIASEEHLKDAIDTINQYCNEQEYKIPHQLHYVTTYGNYVIGSDVDTNNNASGDDTINVNNTILNKDIVMGNSGNDTINGLSGDDVLIGDSTTYKVRELESFRDNPSNIDESKFESNDENRPDGNDEIYGGNGNDILAGGGGSDYLDGGADDDYLYGGKGNDVLLGGEGNDNLKGGDNDDVLIAGTSNLSVSSLRNLQLIKNSIDVSAFETQNGGTNTLNGGSGDDLLIGDKSSDYLLGGDDNDYLYGSDGNDYLEGGKGNDYLYGGAGIDDYKIEKDGGLDVIYDSDGIGAIWKDGWILTGAVSSNPNTKIWMDTKGNTYYWDGIAGSDLVINNSVVVKNFHNYDLEIRLEKLPFYNTNPDFLLYYQTVVNRNPVVSDLAETKKEELKATIEIIEYIYQSIQSDGILQEPIVFDLDGNGIDIKSNAVYFDHDNDGFAEASAWVSGNDGLLVTDTNNNGIIDNSTELVKGETISQFDTNNDGIIDSNDTDFSNLKILKADGTLLTLTETGISSINLNTQRTNRTYEDGSNMFERGTYTTTDGRNLNYGEFNFKVNPNNALEKTWTDVTNDISALPYIDNLGKSRSLWQAMMLDETNTLKNLVTSFVNETNDDTRMSLIDQILTKWAGAQNIETNSRGENINAKHNIVKFKRKDILKVA